MQYRFKFFVVIFYDINRVISLPSEHINDKTSFNNILKFAGK